MNSLGLIYTDFSSTHFPCHTIFKKSHINSPLISKIKKLGSSTLSQIKYSHLFTHKPFAGKEANLNRIYDTIDHPKYKETKETRKNISKIDQACRFIQAVKIPETVIKEMQQVALTSEAHYTTHIEGTELSLYQSKQLLRGEEIPNAPPDDVRELKNYPKAFDQVAKSIEADYALTEIFIREMHRLLLLNVPGDKATPGEYRAGPNCVSNSITKEVIYTPPDAYEVPFLMSELVKWMNSEEQIHPVLIAGIAQFQLVHIHPFLDGNGRVARSLSTLCLYRSSYDFKQLFTISEYYDKNKPAYYKAIQDVRDNDMDLTGWLEYFTLGLSTQTDGLVRKSEEIAISESKQELQRASHLQKQSLEFLNFQLSEIIQKYMLLCPFLDRKKLKDEMYSAIESDL